MNVRFGVLLVSLASTFGVASAAEPPALSQAGVALPLPEPIAGSKTPYYSSFQRTNGHEGLVKLAMCVDANGKASDVKVLASSGHEGLDSAAKDWAVHTHWTPANGAQSLCYLQPVRFSITEGTKVGHAEISN